MDPHTIIFIGPQGSGKGTQIELLSRALKEKDQTRRVLDVQTGRRFRALSARGEGYTERKVQETLDTGILQPLFLSVMLWGEAFSHHANEDEHLLIDGFPRTLFEAKVLESALSFYNRTHLTIFNLKTSEVCVRNRMLLRARKDDTIASIDARLRCYREETLPVLEYYKERKDTTVIDCDGEQSIEDIHKEIKKAFSL